jgi:hypothetical protein
MRALALLEIWLKKQPTSALVPHCALPLLRALRAAQRPSGDAPLAKRLAHVLTHQLAACKPALPADLDIGLVAPGGAETESEGPADALARVCNKVLYFATREEAADVRAAATKIYACLLGAIARAAASNASDPAAALLDTQCAVCVDDVLQKRKSHWTHAALAELMAACKPAAPRMLRRAVPLTAAARTEFARVAALQTCAACLRCAPALSTLCIRAGVAAPRVHRDRVVASTLARSLCCFHGADADCSRRHAAQQHNEFKALNIEQPLASAIAAVAGGGLAQGGRWSDALTAAASALEAMHVLHDRRPLRSVLPGRAVDTLLQAIAQGLSGEDVPVRCSTQLHRMKKVLTDQGQVKGVGGAAKKPGQVTAPKAANTQSASGGKRSRTNGANSKASKHVANGKHKKL